MSEFERSAKNTENKQVKRRFKRDVLKQRQGWQRFRKSARDHIGRLLGGIMTFAGGSFVRTATGLQAAHLTWFSLQKSNVTKGIHDPLLKDAVAGTVGVFVVRSKSPSEQVTAGTYLPLVTISVAIARSVGIINRYFEDDVNPMIAAALQVVIAGIGTALLSISPVPLPLVATSIAGATLMYQSFIAEVVGSWFYMLERISVKKRRSIRQKVYHSLQKKLLYPVHSAFEQINAAIHNETLASPSLHQKVNDAIYRSYQVRIVWACATAGIVLQALWSRFR